MSRNVALLTMTTTVFGAARLWSRAAIFGVSPNASCSRRLPPSSPITTRRDVESTSFSSPHQHSAALVNGKMVDLEQFLFKGLQGLIIQPELELESTVRHAPTALEQGNHL